jgi:hypothetical protein
VSRAGWLRAFGAWIGLLGALGWPRSSVAWTQSGHMQIAAYAYDALPERTRSSWVALLRQHPRFEHDFLAQLPADVRTPAEQARWIFLWAAVWPDLLRGQPELERGNWHYVNLPLALRNGALASCRQARAEYPESHRRVAAELARRHPAPAARATASAPLTPLGPDEIRQALAWARRTLGEPKRSAPERAVALSWLLHLVGDAHQPLHAVALFTPRRFEFGDRGGNDIRARDQGSLHQLWDGLLGEDTSLGFVTAQARRWRQTPALQPLAREARRSLDVETWLDEDCALARSSVYTPAVLSAVQSAEAAASVAAAADAKPELALDALYRERAQQAAERRAVQAAARLGALLESLPAQLEGRAGGEGPGSKPAQFTPGPRPAQFTPGPRPAQFKSDGLRLRP